MEAGIIMEENRKLNLGSLFIGIAVGAVIGGGLALLFAPKSGRETRELIRGKAIETGQMIQERAIDVKEKASQIGQVIRSRGEKEIAAIK